MSIEKVKNYFQKYGLEDRIMELKVSSATVKDAALALSCREGEIAKTLAFKVNHEPILIVMAGDVRIDNTKYKQFFHEKAAMIEVDQIEELIGHQVGGVCPFAIPESVTVYLDNSLKEYKIVYPACGNSHSAIPLTVEELEKTSSFQQWIDVSKK